MEPIPRIFNVSAYICPFSSDPEWFIEATKEYILLKETTIESSREAGEIGTTICDIN